MTQFDSPLSRFLADAVQDLGRLFPDDTPTEPDSAPINIRKLSVHIPVSCCYLTDTTGENHCQHPPAVVKPLPWTWRARERWWGLRERAARRIAGHTWPIEED